MQPGKERLRPRWRGWWPALPALLALMTGCSASLPVTPQPKVELPASLRQPCDPVPVLQHGDNVSVFLYVRALIAQYGECSAKHDAIVDAWPK